MKRKIIQQLINWKELKTRKCLVLHGTRQTGKTFVLNTFAKENFSKSHYFDFMSDSELKKIFDTNLNTERIIRDLEFYINKDIDLDNDLIVFDEIQECPQAITALKYFTQNYPKAFICASGSLLGLSTAESSYPVGKVTTKTLYPMSFEEFLLAMNQKRIVDLFDNLESGANISDFVHRKIWDLYKYYMITGGLPEVVKLFRDNQNHLNKTFSAVRDLQKEIYSNYLDDISKHSGSIKSVKIQAVFKNIPIQLARENKTVNKFVFKDVLTTDSRYANLEGPIEWLIKTGLVIKVPICNNAQFPLKAYADEKRFKLYMFDVGIMGAILNLSPKVIYNYDYGSYKGYFAENLALQEMTASLNKRFYSWSKNTSEIEFLTDMDEKIIPIEIKAGINTKAKSLKVYKDIYSPEQTILFSGRPIDKNSSMYPLYTAHKLKEICEL